MALEKLCIVNENNGDVIRGDQSFITENLCYKVDVWSLKDMDVYQTDRVRQKMLWNGDDPACLKFNLSWLLVASISSRLCCFNFDHYIFLPFDWLYRMAIWTLILLCYIFLKLMLRIKQTLKHSSKQTSLRFAKPSKVCQNNMHQTRQKEASCSHTIY